MGETNTCDCKGSEEMDERDFELLIRLDETRNITQAAAALFTTQSAISKRIQVMERELGTQLLLRNRKGVSFTPQGELALDYAHKIYDSTLHMRAALGAKQGEVRGTLNLGVSVNFAQFSLPQVIQSYRSHYPEVNIHILTGQSRHLIKQLTRGDLEIAIVRGEHVWRGEKILLSSEPIYAIAPSGTKENSLQSLPYIAHRTDPVLEEEKQRWMAEQNITLQSGHLYVDHIITCVELVRQGLGWTIVPQICIKDFTGYQQALRFADGSPFLRSTYLCTSARAMKLPQVKALTEILKS